MTCFEIEKYKIAVTVSEEELLTSRVTIDDILERTPKGWGYLQELKHYAVRSTKYEWPGCAFSMEIKLLPQNEIMLVFSETVKDFVNGLKTSQKIADHGSILLRELIKRIDAEDEDGARKIIKEFENSVREVKEEDINS